MVVDDYVLNEQRWIKILATTEIPGALDGEPRGGPLERNIVYKFSPAKRPELLSRFIGVD
jgi:hypothetical protein